MLGSVLRRGYGLAPLGLAVRRCGLSSVPKRSVTLEEAMTSSHLILEALQSPTAVAQLSAVRNAPDTLTKWQQTNAMLVQATLHAIPSVGFTPDLQGLQLYTEAFAQHMRTDQEETRRALEQINEQKWAVLLKHAYDCEPAPAVSLAEARAVCENSSRRARAGRHQCCPQAKGRAPRPAWAYSSRVGGGVGLPPRPDGESRDESRASNRRVRWPSRWWTRCRSRRCCGRWRRSRQGWRRG